VEDLMLEVQIPSATDVREPAKALIGIALEVED
jgi:hypothetical protein